MVLPLLSAVGPLAKIVGGIVDKAIPDKDLKEKLKHELNTQLINGDHEELIAKSNIIKALVPSSSAFNEQSSIITSPSEYATLVSAALCD